MTNQTGIGLEEEILISLKANVCCLHYIILVVIAAEELAFMGKQMA